MMTPLLSLSFSGYPAASSGIRALFDTSIQDFYLSQLEAWERTVRNQRYIIWILAALCVAFMMTAGIILYIHRLRKRKELLESKALELRDALVKLHDSGNEKTVQECKAMLARIVDAVTDVLTDVQLTRREIEIARLCAEGLLSKEVGDRLGISQRTVETHKNNIFRKLGINTTVELVRLFNTRPDLFE